MRFLAVSKKYQITLGDDSTDILEAWAKAEGLPPGTIGSRLLTNALVDAKAKGVIPTQRVDGVLKDVLTRIGSEWVDDPTLIEAAHDTGVPVDVLKKIRDCLHKNGGRKNVHQR